MVGAGEWEVLGMAAKKNRNLDPIHSSLTDSDAAFNITHPECG